MDGSVLLVPLGSAGSIDTSLFLLPPSFLRAWPDAAHSYHVIQIFLCPKFEFVITSRDA